MKVLLFIADHWQDILVVILLIVSAITGVSKWTVKNGPIFGKMTTAEKMAYITRLLTNLVPIALVLVTDAEVIYGGGTGALKRSYVIDELYRRIPDEYKKYITEENMDSIINAALEQAEKLWHSNTNVNRIVYGATQSGDFNPHANKLYSDDSQ